MSTFASNFCSFPKLLYTELALKTLKLPFYLSTEDITELISWCRSLFPKNKW